MSAVLERVSKQLERLYSELEAMGIEAGAIKEVAKEVGGVEGLLVTPALANMVEEIGDALSRFSASPTREGVEALGKELKEVVERWVPRCRRASSAIKWLALAYSLSLITISVAVSLSLAPASIPNAVASLFTIFVCSLTIFGILLGMNMMLLLLPLLPVAPLAQCASLAVANTSLTWVCIGVGASLALTSVVAITSVRSYRRALLAFLSIASSVDSIIEKLRGEAPSEHREEVARVEVREGVAEEVRELPRDVYGEDAEELAKYGEEMKKLR